MVRLNKYLAECGFGSRRYCDKLISDGCVTINGKVATCGSIVEENDKVAVNGKRAVIKNKKYYIVFHKPKGCVTTVKDDLGRKTVMDYIDFPTRLFPVGRLDYDTEGLLLLTNDGDIANKLTHPRCGIPKSYVARISGSLTENERRQLESGVVVDGSPTLPAEVKILEKDEHHTRVSITITEGRNRQIKKMFEAVGKEVEFLKRVSEGEIHLGGLARGKWRFLTDKELEYLRGID